VQHAGQHLAPLGVQPLVDEIADQDLVAGVLAVTVDVGLPVAGSNTTRRIDWHA